MLQAEQTLSSDGADESNGDDAEDWAPELLICIAGLAAALTGKAGDVSHSLPLVCCVTAHPRRVQHDLLHPLMYITCMPHKTGATDKTLTSLHDATLFALATSRGLLAFSRSTSSNYVSLCLQL